MNQKNKTPRAGTRGVLLMGGLVLLGCFDYELKVDLVAHNH